MDARWRKGVAVGTVAITLFTSCSTARPTASPSPTRVVDTPTATLTVYASTPTPMRPVLTNTPTSTLAAPTPAPTEAPVPIAVVEERMAAEFVSELAPLDVAESHIDRALFNAMNPGQRLLVPEGWTYQSYTSLTYEGRPVAVMNVNVPLYWPRPLSDPVINRLENDNLITWEDNEGDLVYHVPMAAASDGLAPVVFAEGNQLRFGLVDGAGRLDPASIADYWQPMPAGMVRAVMAKYVPDNTVYVTLGDTDGNQIEGKRLKVVTLPHEKPASEAMVLVGFSKVWNGGLGRWEYIDISGQNIAFWNATASQGKGSIELVWGPKSLDFEKHKGLFVGWTAEQAEASVREELAKGSIVMPLPFDPNSSGGILELRQGKHELLCFRGMAEGVVIKAPVSGKTDKFGVTSGKEFCVTLNDDNAICFIFPKAVNLDGIKETMGAGQQLVRLGTETFPRDFGYLGVSYQFIVGALDPNQSRGYDLGLQSLLRDESGKLVFVE